MDCVTDEGEVIIAYAARLRWRSISLHYASILTRSPGKDAHTETSMRKTDEPVIDGDALTWSAPALSVSGRWSSLAAPSSSTIFDAPEGKVEWRCLGARADAEITLGDRVVRGRGYAEHLVMSVEPWRMPIDSLRWGRFVGERSSLVWIDWRGAHEKHVALLDGEDIGRVAIDERSVIGEGVRLDIDEGGSLRKGDIGTTALARVPGLDRFPIRILDVDEQKWCARATLEDGRGRDEGWVIHEVVRWPEAKREPTTPRTEDTKGHALGKFLYAFLFVAALPTALVAWARATERVVFFPALHAPTAGIAVASLGALLMVAGWFALWRHGGGLPMNAFPPPKFVTRGAYGIVSHPIYVGFVAICFGVSIATGSASGLWLVSPTIALGALALVLGYEGHDLEARFGEARTTPWISLPDASDASPALAQRAAAFVMAFVPWLALKDAPFATRDFGALAAALLACALLRTERDRRALTLHALLAMPLVFPLHTLVPSITPSATTLIALLAADACASRAPRALWFLRALALVIATSDAVPPRSNAIGIAASVFVFAIVVNAEPIWQTLRAITERVANSWHETRIGPVRIINHGIWAGLSTLGGLVIIGTLLGPAHVGAIVFAASAGLVGAGLWAQTIEGSSALSRPYGFYGGLLGICIAAIAAPLFGTPIWLLLGAFALAGPYIQAMGRMRCLVQGCCHGRETGANVGIRYHHPRSRVCRLAHLDNVPLHATQLYSILWNAATLVVLARLWSVHAELHLIGGVYLLLNGVGRFCEEAYRGEPQTPIIARLRLYQWIAVLQMLAGAFITAVGSSAAAPSPHINASSITAAAIFSVITWFALGVDFPDSNRRFSRLA